MNSIHSDVLLLCKMKILPISKTDRFRIPSICRRSLYRNGCRNGPFCRENKFTCEFYILRKIFYSLWNEGVLLIFYFKTKIYVYYWKSYRRSSVNINYRTKNIYIYWHSQHTVKRKKMNSLKKQKMIKR